LNQKPNTEEIKGMGYLHPNLIEFVLKERNREEESRVKVFFEELLRFTAFYNEFKEHR